MNGQAQQSKPRSGRFDHQSFWIGAVAGAAGMLLAVLAFAQPDGFDDLPPPSAAVSFIPPRDCAARTVYFTSIDDDWSQRALIASTVLNRSAPGADAIACAYPSPLDAGGFPPDAYRWQSATDAADAVRSGDYSLPPWCVGVTAVMAAEAAPRALCVVGDLAFVRTP